ncbi:MAG: aromatic ring-hydroxylating dioxygenase subunit alpha [Deltaproteobacteria bacterium]|nr:aromatic ring-hydroxylating dioxygenase subunit alpha [Deltaproteobacteria bacterium]
MTDRLASVPDLDAVPPRGVFHTDRYTAPAFLELERARVFGRTWIVIGRESDVPHPGDRLPVEELGESLFVVRGDDRHVRTFRNTCRHRGTRLVARACSARHITCPYHGWSYALDGRLLGVPKLSGFDALPKPELGLLPVRTECWAGFVWITFDPQAPPLVEYLGELAERLPPYRLEEMRPLLRRSWTLPCNWKSVLDQATESYHLPMVHGASIARVIDTLSTFHGLYPHHLQTIPIADYGWRAWLDRSSTPADLAVTPEQLRLFHKYVIFPNTLINVMPYHLTVFRVFPLTPDTCRFHYEFHLRRRPGLIGRLRGWATLLASLYILREDFGVLLPFQSGLHAAADRRIWLHREERPLEYFHAVVDDYLDRAPPPA